MFLGRQAAITSANNCCIFLANRHHFLFNIDSHHQQSQLKKKKKKDNFINDRHHQQFIGIKQQQQQQPFGSSLALLESTKDGKQTEQKQAHSQQSTFSNYYYNTQVGASNKMLLLLMVEQQKRFFSTATTSSSSSFGEEELQQQQRKQQNELVENGSSREEEQKKTEETLAHSWMRLDATSRLNLNLRQGKQRKYFKLIKSSVNRSNIVGPPNLSLEIGYPLVSAMDTLLETLAAKHAGQINNHSSEPGPLVLESQHIDAHFFDLQLELVWLGGNNNNAYVFKIITIKTAAIKEQHGREKKKLLPLPIRALPWLRHAMAQMLVEHDGSQQLGPAPPELPESILQARPIVQKKRPPQLRSSNQRQQQKQRFFSAAEKSSSSAAHQHIGKRSSKEAEEQHQKQKQLPTFPKEETLAHKWMLLDSTSKLRLNLEQGERRKFFCLTKSFAGRNNVKFPNFAVGYGYPLVSAMDVLLKTLAAAFKHQEEFNHSAKHHQQLGPLMLLQSQRVNTHFFDIQLELVRLGNVQNAYVFKVKIVKTVGELRERELLFPVRALPWLRHAMAQMLVEHDDQQGSQQLGPAPPLPWELLETILQVFPPLPPVAVVQTRLRPQFLNNQQRQQQQKQQFVSHQRKSSAANRLPSPPPFHGQQQFRRSPHQRSSPSSNFGAAPLPQQQQQPKITTGHGKATAQNQQNDASLFRMRKPVVQQTAGQWRNRQPQQQISQQQRIGTGQAWMDNRNKWVNNKSFPPPPPPPVQTRRRPQLHNNQRQQQQQFASHQAPSSSARRLLPSSPPSFYGRQQLQATYHQPQAKKFVQTAAAAVTGRHGTTANQQQDALIQQTKKPANHHANQHQKQTVAGQRNHRQQQQPPTFSQQQYQHRKQRIAVGAAGQATGMDSNRITAKLPTPPFYGQQQFHRSPHQPTNNNRFAQTAAATAGHHGTANQQQNSFQTRKPVMNQANHQQQTAAGQWNHRRQQQPPIFSQQQYQQRRQTVGVAGQATGMDNNRSRTAKLPTPPPPSFYGQQQFHHQSPPHLQSTSNNNRFQSPPHLQSTNNNNRFVARTTAVDGRHGYHQGVEILFNSFQPRKPAVNQTNQHHQQQNAGQWNRRQQQQPPTFSQHQKQQNVGVTGAQATRMDSNRRTATANNKTPLSPPPSPLPPVQRLPINKATTNTNAGTHRVASVPWPQQQKVHRQKPEQHYSKMKKKETNEEEGDKKVKGTKTPLNKAEEEADDIFKLLHEVEALAKEVEEEKSRKRRSAIGNEDDGRKRRRR